MRLIISQRVDLLAKVGGVQWNVRKLQLSLCFDVIMLYIIIYLLFIL